MYASKLIRFTQKIFGWDAGAREMVKFGTPTEGRPLYIDKLNDPAAVQTKYYEQGWFPESLTGNIRPYAEDMNGVHFVHSYQLAYMLQAGIPEWDSDTPYFEDCICRVGKILYISNIDNNVGHNPVSDTGNVYWNIFTLGEQGVPVGASLEWNGMTVPNEKWMFENGAALLKTDYPELFAVIGYTFGGSGNTFNLPNSTGRVAIGYQSGEAGLTLGRKGGQFNHQHFVPAHYHDLGDIRIIDSGEHVHVLRDSGHYHKLSSHQHKFRFGDYGVTTKQGGTRVVSLGSAGKSGTDNNPTTIGYNNGVDGSGKGHFMKMTSQGITNANQDSSPAELLQTGTSQTGIVCQSATHTHRRGVFAGHVGAISKSNGDTGTMQTVSTNNNAMSSNMPFIVKRKIIRVKP